MVTTEELKKDVKEIKERNKRVEADKAWEISYTRKFLITALIYVIMGLYLRLIDVTQPWLNAIVPAAAFLLSTLILPFLKRFWRRYIYKN